MPDDKAKRMADEALHHLMEELEQGRSEALTNYLSAMSRFHRYSWNNALLIHAQRPNATRVAGFHTWHDLDRSVRKGEKGIAILAPIIVKQKESPQTTKDPAQSEDVRRLTGFRTAYVFDVSQTEGKPLPEFAKTTGDPKDYTTNLKALAAKQGISVEYDANIAPAMGVSSGGRIRIATNLMPAEEFSVLTHELAHEMLHHRKDITRPPEVVRETEAEAVAYVVGRSIGLRTNSAAADYIKLYNGDKKTLAGSLAVIQETSSKILDELLPDRQRAETPARRSTTTARTNSTAHERDLSPSGPQNAASNGDRSDSMAMDR